MKTFFSIIYLPFKPSLQEKISVGLVMSNGEKSIFKVSNSKLQILKNLLPFHKYNLLKSYFNDIINEIEPKKDQLKFNVKDSYTNNWLNESYFNYLNKYSNNLVVYSKPKKIDLDISSENFKKIFEKLVFNFSDKVDFIKSENILSKVNAKLYTKISGRVNLNVTLKSSDFDELLTPVDVNFIGKNGAIVAGQTIDFVKRLYNLEHDLTSFVSFTKAVDFSNDYKNKGKYFLVGQEPNKKEHPKNHLTWKHVKESHLVDYVDLSEIERIKDYIISKEVTPFFEIEQ